MTASRLNKIKNILTDNKMHDFGTPREWIASRYQSAKVASIWVKVLLGLLVVGIVSVAIWAIVNATKEVEKEEVVAEPVVTEGYQSGRRLQNVKENWKDNTGYTDSDLTQPDKFWVEQGWDSMEDCIPLGVGPVTVTRKVICYDALNKKPLDDTKCVPSIKPTELSKVIQPPDNKCAVPVWYVSNWYTGTIPSTGIKYHSSAGAPGGEEVVV